MTETLDIGRAPTTPAQIAALAALDPLRRAIFDRFAQASQGKAAADAEAKRLGSEITAILRKLSKDEADLLKLQPVKTFHDLWRAQMASKYKQQGRDVPEHLIEKEVSPDELDALAEMSRQITETQAGLTTMRADLDDAKVAGKLFGNQMADALADWMGHLTPEQNTRQYLKSEIEKRALAAKGLAPEIARPRFQSVIDAQAAHSKGGPISGRYGAFRRGASPNQNNTPRPKLPSEV